MVLDSVKNGKINLANPLAVRPILHIHDLCKGILRILEGGPRNQFYNFCNINGSMEFYANAVSKYLNSEITMLESSPTYNFMMSTSKFEKDYDFAFKKDLPTFLDDIRNAVPC
jgi:nucleoside-diphosphate-sugar epimerase